MKKEHWIVLICFITGCVMTNYLGKEIVTSHGIFNDYFLNQYTYHEVNSNRLLCRIIIERVKLAIAVFLFGRVMRGKWFSVCVKGIVAAIGGFLLTTAIINLGVSGLVICVVALIPQWIFYLFAIFFYLDNRGNNDTSSAANYLGGIVMAIGILLGMLLECYVNPVLLYYALKIF